MVIIDLSVSILAGMLFVIDLSIINEMLGVKPALIAVAMGASIIYAILSVNCSIVQNGRRGFGLLSHRRYNNTVKAVPARQAHQENAGLCSHAQEHPQGQQ